MRAPAQPWRTAPADPTGVAQYLVTLRARSRFIVISLILALGAATAYLKTATDTYEAHAQVLVQPLPSDATTQLGLGLLRETGDPTRPLETLARIVTTQSLARRVIKELRLKTTPRALLLDVSAQPVAQSNIVDIAVRSPSPVDAQRIANAFGQGIVDQRTERLRRELDAVIPRLRAEVNGLSASARNQPGSPLEQLRELETLRAGSDPTVRLETPAPLPTSPVEPRPLLTMIAAILGGLGVGIGGAFLLQLLDPRLRRESQLRSGYRLPVLARVAGGGRKTAREGQFSREVFNDYRALRVALSATTVGSRARTVAVTSPPCPGPTPSAAAGLAWSLARAGDRVLLIDGAVGRAPLAEAFGIHAAASGLAEVLSGTATIKNAVVQAGRGDADLILMAPGRLAEADHAAFSPVAATAFLETITPLVDWVVLDAPPLDRTPDLFSLVGRMDDLIVVVHSGVSRLNDIETLTEALEQHAITPRGFVVVGG